LVSALVLILVVALSLLLDVIVLHLVRVELLVLPALAHLDHLVLAALASHASVFFASSLLCFLRIILFIRGFGALTLLRLHY
jgi:hypothetical protein